MPRLLLVVAFLLVARGARAALVWVESEQPTRNTVQAAGAGWGNMQYLSEGKWLHVEMAAEELPKDGAPLLEYDFTVAAAGNYEVWNRTGLISLHPNYQWRLDGGAWQTVSGDHPCVDLMRMDFWCEIAWVSLGKVDLTAGAHTLAIRGPQKADGTPLAINYTSDVLCLSSTPFRPHSKYRPDAEWRTDLDRAAERQVFRVAVPKAPGERAVTSLSGTWQIARADETTIDGRTEAIPAVPDAAVCDWLGIAVPGNRDELRPDLVFCHRYFYRAALQVPAEAAGRACVLHFPCNSLMTTVFVNGVRCGFTRVPYAAWDCDITQAIKPGARNDVWVGIKDTYYARPDASAALAYMPVEHFHATWNTEHFDFPVAGMPANGMLLPPTLIVSGPAYTADVFALPSVKTHNLTLEITLANPGAADVSVMVENEIAPLEGGKAEKLFIPMQYLVPAGKSLLIRPTEAWPDAKLWWPDDPRQYVITTRLNLNGIPIDTVRTKFGFREWEWDGPDFKLNGVPWHFRADTSGGTPAQLKAHGQNIVRLWGSPLAVPEAKLDEMDAAGMCVRHTGIFDGEGGAYGNFLGGEGLFQNWIDQTKAWVKSERNHPSVCLWSVENEITFINARNWGHLPQWEPWATKCWQELKTLDPTRPIMVDGGRALMDKSLPVYGCHYEETFQREYPDEAYTLHAMLGTNDYWKQPWPMDRSKPIFIGESFYVRGYPPAYFAGVGGEQAFLGRAEAKEGAGLLLRMLSEGYRWNGISFHFWVGGEDADAEYPAWSDVALLSRQWNRTLPAGATAVRNLRLFNDTRYDDPIIATWQLKVEGKDPVDEGKLFNVAPGMTADWNVALPVPKVKFRADGTLTLLCTRGGHEVFRDVKPLAVLNTDADVKPKLGKGDLVVYDPAGTAKARLTARKIPFSEVASVAALPATAKVVLIGADALTAREATDPLWQALAAGGARVIVLEQAHPLHHLALASDLEPTTNAGRVAFVENLKHPLFDGLAQADFFTWAGDHVVYRNAYKKATFGAASLVQCDEELNCTALALCPVNDGALLLSQLVIGAKLGEDPCAQRLFDNLLVFAAGYAPVRKRTAVVMDAASPEAKLLAASGLQYDTVGTLPAALGDGYQIVVTDATPENLHTLVANQTQVNAFTARGGALLLWGLTDKGLADFNTLVGVQHLIRPFEMERVTLPAQRDPLIAGLTMRDVVMESSQAINQWSGDRFAAADIFTSVVDVDDVAPFATIPDGKYFGYDDAKPGWDHYPRNIFNGFTSADSWKYAFTINTKLAAGNHKWTMTFPAAQEISAVSLLFTPFFAPVRTVKLYCDDDPTPLTFPVAGDWKQQQTFTLPAPRKAKVLTVELAEFQRGADGNGTVGVDNMWVHVQRSPEFRAKVKPLLNIGALVKYQFGNGCIVLNNLQVPATEANPVNGQKKRAIAATLLRNLGAVFSGARTVIAGAKMTAVPIPLEGKCNAFLTHDKGWFDARDLAAFPKGEVKLTGVNYTIRDFKTSPLPACVMLAGPGTPPGVTRAVTEIPIHQKADALFFLHTAKLLATWTPPRDGDKTPPVVWKYVVHYADGTTLDAPVRYNDGVGNWLSADPQGLPHAAVAWAAPYPAGTEQAVVYQFQWTNPKPDVEIATLDLTYDATTNGGYAVPVLLAVSAAVLEK